MMCKFIFTSQLLMFFVPKMKYSLSGHVVSIQSVSSGTSRPLLDTRGEIQRMVQLLARNDTDGYINETEAPAAGALLHSFNVQLTTVLCDQNFGRQNADSKINLSNAVDQIIGGIQRDRSVIIIKESKSLIQSVLDFFFKIK